MSTVADSREILNDARRRLRMHEFEGALERLRSLVLPSHDEDGAVTRDFLIGLAVGNGGGHDEATRVAEALQKSYPTRPEGYFLHCMALHALNGVPTPQWRELINSAQTHDTRRRGEEAAAMACDLLMEVVQRQRRALRRLRFTQHAQRYDTFAESRCDRCEKTYPHPTPEWLCPHCWPQHAIKVWQPDSNGRCSGCEAVVGWSSRHHCRCCGRLFCKTCTPHTMRIPLLNFQSPVKVCTRCMERRNASDPNDPSGIASPRAVGGATSELLYDDVTTMPRVVSRNL